MDNGHRSSLDKSIRLRRPSAHDKHRQADIDDLAARLRFVPARGEVWFDDRRMVLLHNSSLDAIRRELIETVGIEKACGLITRMGYQSGTRDAEMVRRIRPDSNDFDAFAVGPQAHALEGFVSVETGHFYGEFIWHNSAEAEPQEILVPAPR